MCNAKHLHVVIWAAEEKHDEGYKSVTYVEVIAQDVEDALKQAKKLAPGRRHYWVNNVITHHGHEDK